MGDRYPRFFLVRFGRFLEWCFNLCQSVIGVESYGLNLILIGQFIQSEPLSADSRIDIRAIICVILDYVSQVIVLSFNVPGFQQFSKQFNLPSLYLGNQSILLLGLTYLDVLDALRILLSDILLTLNDCLLNQLQPLPVHLLYFVLLLGPLTHLLVLHQPASHMEAGLVGNGRKGVLEPCSLTVQFNIIEHVDCGR